MSATRAPAAAVVAAAPIADQAVQRVLLNGAALFGAYVVPRALTFTAALVAARVLGPARFGVYGTAASFAMILSILATLGMLPLLVRELARAPERAPILLRAAQRVKLVAAVVMLTVLSVVGLFVLRYPLELTLAAAVLGVGWACWALAENAGAWYQAQERMHIWFRANVVFGVVSGTLGIVAVVLTSSVLWFCAAFAAGQVAAYLWLRRRQSVTSTEGDVTATAWHLIRITLPFAVAFFVLTVFYKIDVLLLQRLQPASVVGIYAAGYKLIDVVHALAVVAAGAVYPRLARVSGNERRSFGSAGSRTLELFLLAAVPGAALLWLTRAPVTLLLFGSAYAETAPVLSLLAPALCALVVNILAGYLLSAAHRVTLLGMCYFAALGLKVTLALWWIPEFGARGAAAAMLCAELALGVALLAILWRMRIALPGLRAILLTVSAAGAAVACGAFLANVPLLAALSCVTVTVLLYRFGGALSDAERGALRAALAPGNRGRHGR